MMQNVGFETLFEITRVRTSFKITLDWFIFVMCSLVHFQRVLQCRTIITNRASKGFVSTTMHSQFMLFQTYCPLRPMTASLKVTNKRSVLTVGDRMLFDTRFCFSSETTICLLTYIFSLILVFINVVILKFGRRFGGIFTACMLTWKSWFFVNSVVSI